MSTVTVPQVNPNDEVTALSVNQGPNAIAAVVNGNIDDTNVSTLSGSKISSGTLPVSAFDTNSNPETRENETVGNIVASGLIWSATTGLGATMTAGVAYVSGKRLSIASVASNTFTASRDTYVYVDNAGAVQYNAQTNGATQPATPANNLLIAKVITNGSTVTNISDLRVTTLSTGSQSWPVIITGATGGTVNYAVFKQIGKFVYFKLKYTLAGAGITGRFFFTPPTTISTSYYSTESTIPGEATFFDAGNFVYSGGIRFNNANSLEAKVYNVGSTYLFMGDVSSTVPFTWGATDSISVDGFYETP